MTIYLIRHGKTEANEKHLYCGSTDLPLSEAGKEELCKLMDTVGISRDLADFGVDSETARQTFRATKDIRDKYVLSRLAWDLGILEELCKTF